MTYQTLLRINLNQFCLHMILVCIIVTNSNPTNFISDIMTVFEYLINGSETVVFHYTSILTEPISYNLHLKMEPRLTWMEATLIKQLLKHMIQNSLDYLSWKLHIEHISHMANEACYALRSIKPYKSQEVVKMVYYAYFYSTMSYGIIYWGNYR
jgi:hypothetical protein